MLKMYVEFDERTLDERLSGKTLELFPCFWSVELNTFLRTNDLGKAEYWATYHPESNEVYPFLAPVRSPEDFGKIKTKEN